MTEPRGRGCTDVLKLKRAGAVGVRVYLLGDCEASVVILVVPYCVFTSVVLVVWWYKKARDGEKGKVTSEAVI